MSPGEGKLEITVCGKPPSILASSGKAKKRMSDRNRLVLLIGSTGYVGGRLLKALVGTDWRVRCLVRHPEFLRPRVAATTEIVAGDVLDLPSL